MTNKLQNIIHFDQQNRILEIVCHQYVENKVHLFESLSKELSGYLPNITLIKIHFKSTLENLDLSIASLIGGLAGVYKIDIEINVDRFYIGAGTTQERDFRIEEELSIFYGIEKIRYGAKSQIIPRGYSTSYKTFPLQIISNKEGLLKMYMEEVKIPLIELFESDKETLNGLLLDETTELIEKKILEFLSGKEIFKDSLIARSSIHLIPLIARSELSVFFGELNSKTIFKKNIRIELSIQLKKLLVQKKSKLTWMILTSFLRGNLNNKIISKRKDLKPSDIIKLFQSANEYATKLSAGLYEIIKNSIDHSTLGSAVLLMRFRENDPFLDNLPILDIQILDFSKIGITAKLKSTLQDIRSTCDNESVKDRISRDLNSIDDLGLKSIYNKENRVNLLYELAVYLSHFGISHFLNTLQSLGGFFFVSSTNRSPESFSSSDLFFENLCYTGSFYWIKVPLKFDISSHNEVRVEKDWALGNNVFYILNEYYFHNQKLENKVSNRTIPVIDASILFEATPDADGSDLIRFLNEKLQKENTINFNAVVINVPSETIISFKDLFEFYLLKSNLWKSNNFYLFYYFKKYSEERLFYYPFILGGKSNQEYQKHNLQIRFTHDVDPEFNDKFRSAELKEPKEQDIQNIIPYHLLIEHQGKTLFEHNIECLLNTSALENNDSNLKGYSLNDSHFRFGNLIHINNFRFASKIFQESQYSDKLAFGIARRIMDLDTFRNFDTGNIKKLLFIGFGDYSKMYLQKLDSILKSIMYPSRNLNVKNSLFFVDQDDFGNLTYLDEAIPEVYEDTRIILIVPVNATLTTSAKLFRFITETIESKTNSKAISNSGDTTKKDRLELSKLILTDIMAPIIVSQTLNENEQEPTELQKSIGWTEVNENEKIIKLRLKPPYESIEITHHYLLKVRSEWNPAESCEWCFSDNYLEDLSVSKTKPIQITNSTGIAPADQIEIPRNYTENPIGDHLGLKIKNKIIFPERAHEFGHRINAHSHYIHFIKSRIFFETNEELIKDWLLKIREKLSEHYNINNFIIISPFTRQHSNFYFCEFVNKTIFNDRASIISYDVKRNQNKNMLLFFRETIAKAKHTVFVDDFIQSGRTFLQVHNFVKTCIYDKEVYRTFDAVISLINKSDDYELNNIYTQLDHHKSRAREKLFCFYQWKVHSFKHEEDCPICNLVKKYSELADESGSEALRHFYLSKIIKLKNLSEKKSLALVNNTSENVSDLGFLKLYCHHFFNEYLSKDNSDIRNLFESGLTPEKLIDGLIKSFVFQSSITLERVAFAGIPKDELLIILVKTLSHVPFINVYPIKSALYKIVRFKLYELLVELNGLFVSDDNEKSILKLLQYDRRILEKKYRALKFYINASAKLGIDLLVHKKFLSLLFNFLNQYDEIRLLIDNQKNLNPEKPLKIIENLLPSFPNNHNGLIHSDMVLDNIKYYIDPENQLDFSEFIFFYSASVKFLIKNNDAFGLKLAENLKETESNKSKYGSSPSRLIALLKIENTYIIKKGLEILSNNCIREKEVFKKEGEQFHLNKFRDFENHLQNRIKNLLPKDYQLRYLTKYLNIVFDLNNNFKPYLVDIISRTAYIHYVLKIDDKEPLEEVLKAVFKNIEWILSHSYWISTTNNEYIGNDFIVHVNANLIGNVLDESLIKKIIGNEVFDLLPQHKIIMMEGFNLYNNVLARQKFQNPLATVINFDKIDEEWICEQGTLLNINSDFTTKDLGNVLVKNALSNKYKIIRIADVRLSENRILNHPLVLIEIIWFNDQNQQEYIEYLQERITLLYCLWKPLCNKLIKLNQTPAYVAYLDKSNAFDIRNNLSHGFNDFIVGVLEMYKETPPTAQDLAICITMIVYLKDLHSQIGIIHKFDGLKINLLSNFFNQVDFVKGIVMNHPKIVSKNWEGPIINMNVNLPSENYNIPYGFTEICFYELLLNAISHSESKYVQVKFQLSKDDDYLELIITNETSTENLIRFKNKFEYYSKNKLYVDEKGMSQVWQIAKLFERLTDKSSIFSYQFFPEKNEISTCLRIPLII